MKIKLDLRSKIPIYIQIIDQVKHLIASGLLLPDDQLPTVRELADNLGVNFTTVARAYRLLDEEGLISTQHGRGTYILPLPADQSKDAFQLEDLERLTRYFLNESARLGYRPEDVAEIVKDNIYLWETEGSPPAEHSA
ncbi:MAG: GntR family transcriptional regulator [Anaerolineales bacterium]